MATLEAVARNAAVDAVAVLLNSGKIKFRTSGNAQVALCTFGATAFAAAAAGTAAANAITDDTNAAGGTVDHAQLLKSDGTTLVMTCTCTATGGGGDFELTSLVIGAGDTVSVTSLSLTQPAS